MRDGGVLDPLNQGGSARYRVRAALLQSWCTISSAREVLDCCDQRGGARYHLRRECWSWTLSIEERVRDMMFAAGTTAVIKEKCAMSFAQGVLCGAVLDCCNQRRRCTISSEWVVLDCCNQSGGTRYRLRAECAGPCNLNRRCAISSAQGAGPLQSKAGCAISSARGGVLDCCNQTGGARYRLARGSAGLLQSKARCRLREEAGPLQSKEGCTISSAWGGRGSALLQC